MSEDCCAPAKDRSADVQSCPACGCRGQFVENSMVAALVTGHVPARQAFWLCQDRDCEVVYFGDAGARVLVSDLRFLPAFKSESPEALVCYCFLHPRSEIVAELRQTGASTLFERIAARVKADGCACEVRNPSGRCCLGDVAAETVRQLHKAFLARTEPVREEVDLALRGGIPDRLGSSAERQRSRSAGPCMGEGPVACFH